jgi:malate dehydrogenase (oxaloacetate-decarboxylating)
MNPSKQWVAENTNQDLIAGPLAEAIAGADVFIGVSAANTLRPPDLQRMGADPIIFALANPDPEILPEDAQPYSRIVATGRSDYPNQINNVLCFPGLFRGLLDVRAQRIIPEIKIAASQAIADVIPESELRPDYIIPSVFDRRVAKAVAAAVAQVALDSGLARRQQKSVIKPDA